MKSDTQNKQNPDIKTGGSVLKCDDIQALLFSYMTRELGSARSDLVREHIRKCPVCQAAAADVQAALDALRDSSAFDDQLPKRLSDKRREHIVWAYTHPVMDWIDRHHVMVSMIIAAIALAAAIALVRIVEKWPENLPEPGPTVIIGAPKENPGKPSSKSDP
ncbi:MAG: zf-HC2 domain-containing protein [Lentisphaerae bacterium]|nr:zf-HC2 domain-containing protein [Lentisphaerota bacterium]